MIAPAFWRQDLSGLERFMGNLVYLDVVNGGVVTIHEEGVYDMMGAGVKWNSRSEVRKYMETRELYICKDFNDFLRFACTGDFLDEDEARFPTQEELEQDYSC